MRVLIVGCGYIGLPLGTRLHQAGHEVYGLRRSAANKSELDRAGIRAVMGDITDPSSLRALPAALDWVVHCVSAGRGGGPEAYDRVYVQGTRNLLTHLAGAPPLKFVYTSSTGVYGQDDGSWVTEASETRPATVTGEILVQAEQLVLNSGRTMGIPAMVLRLAGIYGPGRDYWRRLFLEGNATLDGDGGRFLNMIHRDDVGGAVAAALERGRASEVYNVADDEPVRQRDLFHWLSVRLGKPMPTPGLRGGGTGKRGVTNKRISNRKLRDELRYVLRYPTFRDGFETL